MLTVIIGESPSGFDPINLFLTSLSPATPLPRIHFLQKAFSHAPTTSCLLLSQRSQNCPPPISCHSLTSYVIIRVFSVCLLCYRKSSLRAEWCQIYTCIPNLVPGTQQCPAKDGGCLGTRGLWEEQSGVKEWTEEGKTEGGGRSSWSRESTLTTVNCSALFAQDERPVT